jgi:pyruvate kinase
MEPRVRLTKIIATIGPASVDRLEEIVEAGVDVARINFSHGDATEHVRYLEGVRKASDSTGRTVAAMADLPGPKVRLGEVVDDEVTLEEGHSFTLGPRDAPGDTSGASTDHGSLAQDLRSGDRILLADGAVELRVADIDGDDVVTEIVRGGTIRSRSGVNVPSERLSLPAVTEADRRGLGRADELGFDIVAQSFVRGADDVAEMRRQLGDSEALLVAKIETRPAVEDIEAILETADAVMLARGDLGVECDYEEIPVMQKAVIRRSYASGDPVIVATQMLESMVRSRRPTRAEASDVANAVLDGADAVLLSAETAIGRYPVETIRACARIIEAAEEQGGEFLWERRRRAPASTPEAIAQAAADLTHRSHSVEAMACYTTAGATARQLSAVRPRVPIYAFTPDEGLSRRLTLWRGVVPVSSQEPESTETLIDEMDSGLRQLGVAEGATVLMVGSSPIGDATTNLLKIHTVGSA